MDKSRLARARSSSGQFAPSVPAPLSDPALAVRPVEAPAPTVVTSSAAPSLETPQNAPREAVLKATSMGKLDPLSSQMLEGVRKAPGGSRPMLASPALNSESATVSPRTAPGLPWSKITLLIGGSIAAGLCLLMAGRMRPKSPTTLGTLEGFSPSSAYPSTNMSTLPQMPAVQAPQGLRFG